jgi:gliding motility-associated-like protein
LSFFLSFSENVSVSGTQNHYLQVDQVSTDRVRVINTSELSFFQEGDIVLLIQMTGGTVYHGADFMTNSLRAHDQFNNTGRFEILQVQEVFENAGLWYVVFTDDLTNTYNAGEKIQLVKFVTGETVTVDGVLTAKKWDGITGGIAAVIGMDSVILNANIDVSYKGFSGAAVPAEDYSAGCRKDVSALVLDSLYFLPTQLNRSGNKGEGIISVSWPYTKGNAFALNGGGGGNGLSSGGGGGSNYRAGGNGGQQSAVCTDLLRGAWGGYGCYYLYTQANRQIIMGGGGGTGMKTSLKTASEGGDGGGIVIIITGTLAGNGKSIIANGENSAAATGSGGGGGGGGTVLIDAANYGITTFNVYVKGGNGGSTGSNCTGSGGGGSGGVFWHSGTSVATSVVDTTGGSPGTVSSGCLIHTGDGGFRGAKITGLISPLTGFLFNTIRGIDTLCAGQIPNLLTASQPKGGNGEYEWQWEQSPDKINWIAAAGASDLRSLQPPALTNTMYYRRIVTSDYGVIIDTSRILEVYVYPDISNNQITGTDTICFNLNAKPITGTLPTGGNNMYTYQWQNSSDQTNWENSISETTSNEPFNPGVLTESTYFRRLTTSTAYCTDTSNMVTITVIPSITNNSFVSPDTTICENNGPGLLNAKSPSGGDGSYAYQWQKSTMPGNWTNIPGTNLLRYNPGILTDTTLFRRIVFSGNDDACADTSPTKAIIVLPSLSNNILDTDSSRYCAGDVPEIINGAIPGGGNGTYLYQWRIKSSGNWQNITGAVNKDYLPDQMVEVNTEFSRIVISGDYNACRDTSDALILEVIPYIINNLGLEDQTICQFATPAALTASPVTGGAGTFTYQWIKRESGISDWVNPTGTIDQLTYTPSTLTITTLFARKAFSDICSSISDTVTITVLPAITGNNIGGSPVQYTCYNIQKILSGLQPLNGSGTYAYLWEQSTDKTNWTAAVVPNTELNYETPSLTSAHYFRRIAYSSQINHECIDTSDVVEIRINPLPSGDLISANDTLCAGVTLFVSYNLSGANPPFSVTVGNDVVNQTKNNIAEFTDSIGFTLYDRQTLTMLSVMDDSLCSADLTSNTGVVNAFVYEIPVADAGDDMEICDNKITLEAVKSIAGSSGLWTAMNAVFADSSSPVTSVTVDNYGPAVFTWTETNWHCSDTDQVSVMFYEQPQSPDAGEDQILDFSYTTQLQAAQPLVGTGKWSIVSGAAEFNNDELPDAIVSELAEANKLMWTVTNGNCNPVSDNVEIIINPLNIKKGFTPNGDTRNDFFDIGAVNAEKIKIRIFNSAGILVFESDDYTNDNLWDGRNMNGVELPEGTYFYLIDMKVAGKEKEVQFRSFVEILR